MITSSTAPPSRADMVTNEEVTLGHRFTATSFDVAPGVDMPKEMARADRQQRVFRWLVFGMFAVYILGALALFIWRGHSFRPDPWALFLRDWIPFVLLVFGYEFLRGVAGEFVTGGGTVGDRAREDLPNVRVESLIDFDMALMFGREPVSTLQGWLYTPGNPRWWDYLALIVYSMHFALPCIFAFLLWVTRKERFWQFTIAFCLMTYSAFAFFLLYPAAPPWLANSWGVVSGIGWPAGSVTASIGYDPVQGLDTVSIWQNASPHPVAAMPSLHAGFPWLVLLFAVKHFRWWGLLVLPYNAALWFSVVYLANHWVVDILGGVAWATIAFVIVDWGWNRLIESQGSFLPQPIRTFAGEANRVVARPVASMFAPVWNVPGRARARVWGKLTSLRQPR